ncbi:hypothetical protein Tco_0348664 [Tanacetum coccineum]
MTVNAKASNEKVAYMLCHLDYVVPAAAASDSGILHTIHAVEAVNCYFKRIYTPVKGPLCKHLQVLKEVGENVSHVKLFGDGSRFTFDECDGHANKPKYKPPVPQESPTSIADPNIIMTYEDCHDTIWHGQSQSQVSASTTIQSPTHAVDDRTSMNAWSHMPSRSRFSVPEPLQLLTHAIGTSSTIMNDMSHGQSQSKLPTQLVLSAVMDAVSEGPSQTYVSNHMQFQQHNLNSMRNDQSGRYPTPATHISIIPTASTGTVIGVRKQQFYNYHIDQHQTVRMMSRSAVSEHGLTG